MLALCEHLFNPPPLDCDLHYLAAVQLGQGVDRTQAALTGHRTQTTIAPSQNGGNKGG